jgi:hypothetical protein
MKKEPAQAAGLSGMGALWFGLLGAGLGSLIKHPTIGAVAGATAGAVWGAGIAHLFEDANWFGSMDQSEVDAIKSDITKVQIASALGAAAAGTVGAKTFKKHPTVAGIMAAGVGGAIAAAAADSAFGTEPAPKQIGTSGWYPVGAFS